MQKYTEISEDTTLEVSREQLLNNDKTAMSNSSSDTAPTNPLVGQSWFDTTTNELKVWDGSAWSPTGTTDTATTTANGLMSSTDKKNLDNVVSTYATKTQVNTKQDKGNYVTYSSSSNITAGKFTGTTYKYEQSPMVVENGLVVGGTAQNAGLVTRGICGVTVPDNTTGACSLDSLYINYDGNNTYSRAVVLGGGNTGDSITTSTASSATATNKYSNLYTAVRGDQMVNYVTDKINSSVLSGATFSGKVTMKSASLDNLPQIYRTDNAYFAGVRFQNSNGYLGGVGMTGAKNGYLQRLDASNNLYPVLDSSNYNSYAPTKTGTGASGTWGISISGNSATATKLTTNAGSASSPVYFSDGKPVACTSITSATITATTTLNIPGGKIWVG